MKIKQVIVWRNDLNCRTGKKMAQAGHAACAFLLNKILKNISTSGDSQIHLNEFELAWLQNDYKKVVLKVSSEQELMEIYDKAIAKGLNVSLIEDNGLTEFEGKTKTCLSIGPAEESLINEVTGHLGLM